MRTGSGSCSSGSEPWKTVATPPYPVPNTSIGSLPSENSVDACRTLQSPAEPSERLPQRRLGTERQIFSENLAEGCDPRIVTLRNFPQRLSSISSCNKREWVVAKGCYNDSSVQGKGKSYVHPSPPFWSKATPAAKK